LEFHKERKAIIKEPTFEAFDFAPPGSQVFVSEVPLNDEELRYHKLSPRLLPSGPLHPVYVTREEDARIVRDYVRTHSLDARDLKLLGMTAIRYEMWDSAVDLLTQASKTAPEDGEIIYHLGGSLLKSNRADEASKLVTDYLDRHPDSDKGHAILAAIEMKRERIEEASHHIGRAVEINPNNLEALETWFDLIVSESGVGQAIAELDYLATQHEGAWAPYLVLAHRLSVTSELDRALEYCKKALERERNNETLSAYSRILLDRQEVDEAVNLLEDKASKQSLGPDALFNLATAYAIRGQEREALRTLDSIDLSAAPEWIPAVSQMRRRLEGTGYRS